MANSPFLTRMVRRLFEMRWLASVILLIVLDVATYFALREGSGRSMPFEHFDKVLHCVAFVGLSMLGYIALRFDWFIRWRRSHLVLGIFNMLIWLLYGGMIEILHAYLPYRDASWGDFLANAVGTLVGQSIAWSFKFYPEWLGDE